MKDKSLLLLRMIIVSSLLVACLGAYLKFDILKPLELYQDRGVMELPFLLLTDNGLRYSLQAKHKQETTVPETTAPAETVPPTVPATETPTEAPTQPPTEAPTEPISGTVEESWFDDVLFIGDSRFVGLRDYARLGQAEYFANIGMTVFSVMEDWAQDQNFGWIQIDKLLEERSYGKIIIGLGLNDSGYDDEIILESYRQLLDLIQEKQPDAKIIIHGIITVSRRKAEEAWYFSLDNIYQLNQGMEQLADGEQIFYIDANSAYADEEGYLPDELSGDGCHFYATGYADWAQWIRNNVGYLGIP